MRRTLEHKGYTGSVDFSLEDDVLHGKILFINDLVNYEGSTLQELQKAFEEAVDFYLATCAEEGVAPDKPCSGTFNVRISQELHKQAQTEAARRGLSLNDFVRCSIECELTVTRTVNIHNHEHKHTHIVGTQFESIDDYREIQTWSHEEEQQVIH
jgi:predicted HicB family RNase H-like nuclease